MIEILVSLLILSVGALGMAGLQARVLRGNVSSVQRVQAVMLSNVMMEILRADPQNAKAAVYNMGATDGGAAIASSVCSTSGISNADLPGKNKTYWINALHESMGPIARPGAALRDGDSKACGAVACTAAGECRVRVVWDDRPAGGLEDQAVEIHSNL